MARKSDIEIFGDTVFGFFGFIILLIKGFIIMAIIGILLPIFLILLLGYAIESIINLLSKLPKTKIKYNVEKTRQKVVTPKPITQTNILYEKDKYETSTKLVTKYKVITPYNDLFTDIIRIRGIEYYKNNKVLNYKLKDNICSASIEGSNTYKTSIDFNDGFNTKCTCPYYMDKNDNCKHIYALLLKYCNDNKIDGYKIVEEVVEKEERTIILDKEQLYNKMTYVCTLMEEIINNTKEFNNYIKLPSDKIETYNEILKYKKDITDYRNMDKEKLDNHNVNYLILSLEKLKKLYKKLEIIYDEKYIEEYIEYRDKTGTDIHIFETLFYGFLNLLSIPGFSSTKRSTANNTSRNTYKKSNTKIKEPVSYYGLTSNEKKLVEKGEYEPWNFEEEDLEEDDYYYEDMD